MDSAAQNPATLRDQEVGMRRTGILRKAWTFFLGIVLPAWVGLVLTLIWADSWRYRSLSSIGCLQKGMNLEEVREILGGMKPVFRQHVAGVYEVSFPAPLKRLRATIWISKGGLESYNVSQGEDMVTGPPLKWSPLHRAEWWSHPLIAAFLTIPLIFIAATFVRTRSRNVCTGTFLMRGSADTALTLMRILLVFTFAALVWLAFFRLGIW